MVADPFARAKHKLLDRAMRDGRLTPASRLVFYEIIQHVNRVSGDAWPSEVRLADRLELDVKTVKRALPPLQSLGYIEIKKQGRHNTYRPALESARKGDNLSPVDGVPTGGHPRARERAIGDNLSADRGQFVPSIGDKNGPLSSLSKPPQENFSKNSITNTFASGRAREGQRTSVGRGSTGGHPSEQDSGLQSKADDGRVHLLLMQELGSDVVDALHQTDGGRPLRLITATRRSRTLTPIEQTHARDLAAGELRRKPTAQAREIAAGLLRAVEQAER